MRLSTMALVLGLCFGLCGTGQAQTPLDVVSAISGFWECRDANGIQGVLINSSTRLADGRIDWQTISSIGVYQRLNNRPSQLAYFTLGPQGGAALDGKRLTIELTQLEAVVDSDLSRWSGSWTLCEKPAGPLLQRPRPAAGDAIHPRAGKWEPVPSSDLRPYYTDSLSFYQSADGILAALIDTFSGNARVTEELFIVSAAKDAVVLRAGNMRYVRRFEGTVSQDAEEVGISTDGELPPPVPAVFTRKN